MTTTTSRPIPDTPVRVSDRAAARATLSALSVLLLLAAGIFAAVGSDVGRAACLTLFFVIGLGSACWAFTPELSPAARVSLSFAASLVIVTVVSGVMAEAGSWHPAPVFVVVAVLATGAHLIALGRMAVEYRQRPAVRRRDRQSPAPAELIALAVLAVALVACLVTAHLCRTTDPGVGGYLGRVSPVWYVGLVAALVVASGLLSAVNRTWLQATAIGVTGLILTLTPALAYGTPRSQSAEKHIALVQMIRDTGGLHSTFAVYNGWPGFFSAVAWIADVARIDDPVSLAAYWPALLVLFRIAALRYLAGRFYTNPRLVWGATLLGLLADSLGADYFSPQSVGFVLGLVVFALALGRRPGVTRFALILLIGATITFTHQLSPFIVGGVLVVLAVFRLVKPWWVPLLVLVPAVGWALVHYDTVKSFFSLHSFGRTSNFSLPSSSLPGQREFIVRASIGSVAVAALVLGVLALVTLIRNRRDPAMWGPAVATLVGVAVVTANAYGNEGIIRTVLFALPWLAILAAPTVFGTPGFTVGRPDLTLPGLRFVLSLGLAGLLLVAEFGLDGSSVDRRGDRQILQQAVAQARANPARPVLLVSLAPGDVASSGPTNPSNYNPGTSGLFSLSIGNQLRAADVGNDAAFDAIVGNLATNAIAASRKPAGGADIYALSSPAQRLYGKEYGQLSTAASDALLRALRRSSFWKQTFQRDGTYVFQLDAVAYGARSK